MKATQQAILTSIGALVILAGPVIGQTTNNPEYIFARVSMVTSNGILGLDIPENMGTNTVWDVGTVAEGGVADTWFDDGNPGSFRVRNTGDTAAYVYVTAEEYSGAEVFGGLPFLYPTATYPGGGNEYALAIATNLTDIIPAWRMLDIDLSGSGPPWAAGPLGYLLSGDVRLFDLRFHAPLQAGYGDFQFRIGFYALPMDDPLYIGP